MIFGDRVAKVKLVEQWTLVTLQTAHHGSTSPRFASTQRNHGSRAVSTDFCNKIGQKETFRHILTKQPEAAIFAVRLAEWNSAESSSRRNGIVKSSDTRLLSRREFNERCVALGSLV